MKNMEQNLKLNKDIFKLSLTKIISTVIATLTSMLLARYKSLEEYGTYSQLLIVINLFSSLFMLGLPNCVNYFLGRAENDAERKKFINVFYTLTTILSIVLGISLTLSVNLIVNYFENPFIKSFLYFIALYPWTKIITSTIENVLVVYRRTKLLLILKLIHNITLLLLVLVFQFFGLKFHFYMLAFTIIEIGFMVFDYCLIRIVTGTLRISFNAKLIKKILTYSIPIGVASIIGMLNVEIDKLMIGRFFNTEELGIYSACSAELPFYIISASFTAVILPVICGLVKTKNYHDAIEKWKKTVIVCLAILSIFSFGLFVYSEDVVTLFYSEKYLPGATVFRIYSLGILFKCTYFGMLLNAAGRTKLILFSSIGTLLLNVVLNFVFYFAIGFEGPAVATIVSMAVMSFFQLLFSSKISKVPLSKIFPWREIIFILLLNFLFGCFFYRLKIIISLDKYIGSVFESIILGATWVSCYISIIWKRAIKVFRDI